MNLLSGISGKLDLVINCRAKFYNEFIKINKCPACDGTTFSIEQLYSYYCFNNDVTCVSGEVVQNKNNLYDSDILSRLKP